jgi:UDP-glucose 4-epimerase
MNLAAALACRGAVVRIIGRQPVSAVSNVACEWLAISTDNEPVLIAAIAWADVIFHLTGGTTPQSSMRDPVGDAERSILHTLRFLEFVKDNGKPKIIFASSGGAVYGIPERIPITELCRERPISAYGVSKLAIEKYFGIYEHLYGLESIALRISNPYGPFQYPNRGQGLVATLLWAAIKHKPIEIWGTGGIVRDFIYVEDVVEAMIAAFSDKGPHTIFNVGSSVGLSVNGVADAIDSLSLGPPLIRIYRDGQHADVPINILDTTLITRELGWTPKVAFSSGLRNTADWLAGNIANSHS